MLHEPLTTIHNSAYEMLEYRHTLTRYSFCTMYADSGNCRQSVQKDPQSCTRMTHSASDGANTVQSSTFSRQ